MSRHTLQLISVIDKERCANYLIENGFEDITPKTNGELRYPYILKKKIGEYGIGISVITDPKSERSHVNQLESEDYFRQEYIEGLDEYTTHIIINDRTIIFARTIKFTYCEKYFVKGKN